MESVKIHLTLIMSPSLNGNDFSHTLGPSTSPAIISFPESVAQNGSNGAGSLLIETACVARLNAKR